MPLFRSAAIRGFRQRQLWDLALSRVPPDLARYLVAEGLTSQAVADDPRGYALAVSRSEGWPPWLRILLARPIAYAAGEGEVIPRYTLMELSEHAEPIVALFGTYALAVADSGDQVALAKLQTAAHTDGPNRDFARLLLRAAESAQPKRNETLDEATAWLRTNCAGDQSGLGWLGTARSSDRNEKMSRSISRLRMHRRYYSPKTSTECDTLLHFATKSRSTRFVFRDSFATQCAEKRKPRPPIRRFSRRNAVSIFREIMNCEVIISLAIQPFSIPARGFVASIL